MSTNPILQTEYQKIYELVAELNAALERREIHPHRASDGGLITTLDELVRAILADDLKPAQPTNGAVRLEPVRPFSRILIPSAQQETPYGSAVL